jgi:hypothetical protein
MRTYICLSILLGLVISLSVHYSFWAVFGIMYSGGMLLVILIAFTAQRKESKKAKPLVLNVETGQKIVERQTASGELTLA